MHLNWHTDPVTRRQKALILTADTFEEEQVIGTLLLFLRMASEGREVTFEMADDQGNNAAFSLHEYTRPGV